MPNINEMLVKLEDFQYAMPLDLNIGYYNILLTEYTSSLCSIITPWGKYHCKHVPMGGSNSPEIFQHKMNDLFQGFEFICAYIYKI